jgi:hypothetical protein
MYFFKMNCQLTPSLDYTVVLDSNFTTRAYQNSVECNLKNYSYILGKEMTLIS